MHAVQRFKRCSSQGNSRVTLGPHDLRNFMFKTSIIQLSENVWFFSPPLKITPRDFSAETIRHKLLMAKVQSYFLFSFFLSVVSCFKVKIKVFLFNLTC